MEVIATRTLAALRSLPFAMAVALISGCTFPKLSTAVYRDSEISTSHRGHLVGSIGTNTLPGWRRYDIEFRSKDNKVRGFVQFRSEPPSPLDWDEPNWKGRAFSVALPPGEYEFYIVRLGEGKLTGYQTTEISLPFEIRRDEAVYVGELKWSQTQREVGLLKIVRPDAASFSISDRATRDVPIIKKAYPDLLDRPLHIDIPVTEHSEHSFH